MSEFIVGDTRSDFIDFLNNDIDGEILNLFDNGLYDYLENSGKKEQIICDILYYSKHANDLFNNSKFLNLFLATNINAYYAVLDKLSDNTYDTLLRSVIEDKEKFSSLFVKFDVKYQLKELDNWIYPYEYLYLIIKNDNAAVINKVLNKYRIDLSNDNVDFEYILENGKSAYYKDLESRNIYNKSLDTINIPVGMINENLCNKLWCENNIFKLRKIVNSLSYVASTDSINKFIKNKEEHILDFSKNKGLTPEYDDILNKYTNLVNENNEENYLIFGSSCNKLDEDLFGDIIDSCGFDNIDGVYNYLIKKSSRSLSNYIIDYNFEENYHNVLIDINELLKFANNGHVKLDDDIRSIYESILNIDSLDIIDKINLHNQLKSINIMEKFYDDMSLSRHIVASSIKNDSLCRSSLEKYKNQELSNRYGVNVYEAKNNPFFAIVKTVYKNSNSMLPEGHSYSLVGNNCISVYGDVEDSSTFVYDSDNLATSQLVHVFPFDSFTLYKPYSLDHVSTDRVNMFLTSDELINNTKGYNELLILEKGCKTCDDFDSLNKLNKIALYCIDKIKEEDVIKAKANNIGIFLVNSKDCFKNNQLENIDTDFDQWNYNYFNGINDLDQFESKRL